MKPHHLRWRYWLSLLPFVVTAWLWPISHVVRAGGYWTLAGTRYELCTLPGRLFAVRFPEWKHQETLTLEMEPAMDKATSNAWAQWPGWSVRSQHGFVGFEVADGKYWPPFSWQLPIVDFHLCIIPFWFLALVTSLPPAWQVVRYVRGQSRLAESGERWARPWRWRLKCALAIAVPILVGVVLAGTANLFGVWVTQLPEFPLHDAARIGDRAAVKRLLNKGHAVNATDGYGWTPLHLTASEGHTDIAKLLLSRGAAINRQTDGGETPLQAAVRYERHDMVRLLLARGANVNTANSFGSTPLHEAAGQTDKDLTEILLLAGAQVDARNEDGGTPLVVAAARGSKGVAQLLLAKGADPNATDNTGKTPLHRAAWCGNEEVLRLLLEVGAEPNRKDTDGRTPLDLARSEGYTNIVEILSKPLDG